MDGEAIIKAYPQVVAIYEKKGCFDASGNQVTIEDSKVAEARTTLDAEYTAAKYQRDRAAAYDPIREQLDQLYWDKKNGTNKWVEAIDKVKSDNPKP